MTSPAHRDRPRLNLADLEAATTENGLTPLPWHPLAPHPDEFYLTTAANALPVLVAVVREVLALPRADARVESRAAHWVGGYNAALRDVRRIITDRLEVTE